MGKNKSKKSPSHSGPPPQSASKVEDSLAEDDGVKKPPPEPPDSPKSTDKAISSREVENLPQTTSDDSASLSMWAKDIDFFADDLDTSWIIRYYPYVEEQMLDWVAEMPLTIVWDTKHERFWTDDPRTEGRIFPDGIVEYMADEIPQDKRSFILQHSDRVEYRQYYGGSQLKYDLDWRRYFKSRLQFDDDKVIRVVMVLPEPKVPPLSYPMEETPDPLIDEPAVAPGPVPDSSRCVNWRGHPIQLGTPPYERDSSPSRP